MRKPSNRPSGHSRRIRGAEADIAAINQKLPETVRSVFAFDADLIDDSLKKHPNDENAPLLSVIVPVFNCATFLPTTLDMLLGQTMRNIEVVCINDGSTDDSLAILEARAEKDPRLIVVSQENQGQSSARNKGLDLARGRWFGFVDADDSVPADYFETLCRAAEEGDADIVHCRVHFTYPDGRVSEHPFNHDILRLDTRLPCNKLLFTYLSGFVWNKVYRREVLEGLRFIEGIYWEDNPFTLMAVLKATRILAVPDVYYDYLQRSNSTVSSAKPKLHFDLLKSTALILKFLDKSPDIKKWMYRDFAPSIVWRLDMELLNAQKNKALAPADLKRFKRERFRTLLSIRYLPLSRKLGCEAEVVKLKKHANAFLRPFRILELPFRVLFNLFH